MTDVTTKIELVTEAIEEMTLAQVVLCSGTLNMNETERATVNLVGARKNLSEALKILMTPTLRVLNGGNWPAPKPEHVPYGGEGIEGMRL